MSKDNHDAQKTPEKQPGMVTLKFELDVSAADLKLIRDYVKKNAKTMEPYEDAATRAMVEHFEFVLALVKRNTELKQVGVKQSNLILPDRDILVPDGNGDNN